jgi:concanavalin A-like lectin/glucanase superfamily protein
MRYIPVAMVLLFGVVMLSVPSYAEIDPATIVAFWSFDDGAGGTAEDGSGNALDGNLVGDTEWIDGKVNKALTFDGLEDYVEVPDMLTPPLLTFACWFRRTGPGAGGVPRIHTSGGGPWAFEYGIGNTHQPDQLEFYFAFSDGSTAGWMAFFAPEDNVWYHTAISYDGESVTAYVDGEEVYSNDQWAGKEINQTISRIGGGALGDHFEGDIDEAILFNTAITENDVKDLMSGKWMAVDASGKITSTWGEIKNTALR